MASTASRQWLIFELSEQAYGFDVNHVREIVSLQKMQVHCLPETAGHIEGVVVLRDRPIEVVDIRSALGLCSLRSETDSIAKMLEEREEDHCRWIRELESCVQEQRDFRLATDPHKCKFGLWYDKLLSDPQSLLQLTNQDLALINLLEQLDQPHKRIHAVAQSVLSHAAAGNMAEARRIVDATRDTELRSLRSLFSKCRDQIQVVRRGLLFVFAEGNGMVGGIVDRVSEVATLCDDQILSVKCGNFADGLLVGVAQWGAEKKTVQLLDARAFGRLCTGPAGSPCACGV